MSAEEGGVKPSFSGESESVSLAGEHNRERGRCEVLEEEQNKDKERFGAQTREHELAWDHLCEHEEMPEMFPGQFSAWTVRWY